MTYSNASNARRAAKAQGLVDYRVVPEGTRFAIAMLYNTTGDQLGGAQAADTLLAHAPVAVLPNWASRTVQGSEVVVTTTGLVPVTGQTHKQFAQYVPSRVLKPVAKVHSFCDAFPTLGRKESMRQLVAMGINYATARTQFQVWFQARRGG